MTHVAMAGELDGKSVTWLELGSDTKSESVPDEQAATVTAARAETQAEPSATQKLFGDPVPT